MGIDATASSITLVDPETGKGRVTYLCEGRPERAFVPTRGLWFTNQTPEVMSQLEEEFQRQPYPSAEDMERIAKAVGAPGVAQVKAFFENMRLKSITGI